MYLPCRCIDKQSMLLIREINHNPLWWCDAFLYRLSTFRASEIQSNMIVVLPFWCFLIEQSQCCTLTFPDPLLKWVLMHFPNSSREGNFKRSAWLYVIRQVLLGSSELSICVLWKTSIFKLCNYALNSSGDFSKCCVFPAVCVICSVQIRFFFQFFKF